MSANSEQLPKRRAASVRLLAKMTAIQEARKTCTETVLREQANGELTEEPKCLPQDVAVVAYIVDTIDRATGECIRHYATIGKGCGMSRSAVGRSIKRLVDAGIIFGLIAS